MDVLTYILNRGLNYSFKGDLEQWRRRCFFSIEAPTNEEIEEHYDRVYHDVLWKQNQTALLAKEKAQVLERFIP